jgi:hypothetical protein
MAKMTETAIRNELTVKAVAQLAEILTNAGIEVTRTKDFQTLTYKVGEVDNGTKQYTAYGSIKFTLHKSDFDLDDAVYEYNDKVEMTEKRKTELAEKKAKAEADRQARKAKREADKALKESK